MSSESESSFSQSGFPSLASTPFSDGSEDITQIDSSGLFAGMYVIEFDLEMGEKVVFKQVTHSMNTDVEKQIIGMLMGADYNNETSNTIVLHTITNYHVIVCILFLIVAIINDK